MSEENSRSVVCGLCGRRFEAPKGRGRPREYCSADCREVSSAVNTLRSRVGRVQGTMTDGAWRDLRGALWRMANQRGTNQHLKRRARVGTAEGSGSET